MFKEVGTRCTSLGPDRLTTKVREKHYKFTPMRGLRAHTAITVYCFDHS